MDSQLFRTQCPFCLEGYQLEQSLMGRVVTCSKCHKKFPLEGNLVKSDQDYSLQQEEKQSSVTAPDPSSSVSSIDDPLASETIEELAQRFTDLPEGVWQVGETLLDGMCQVLPLTSDKLYAEGGVGIVQRVRKRDWNIDLIVKSPKPGVIVTEFGKESFERECQTWIELGMHANIVSCYFVRRIDGIPRLFAELAPSGTLNDWIADKRLYAGSKQEALARIIDVAIQFAWGLEHAHQQNLVHLDVKPGNVMTSGSTIKVTDFGLSKFATANENNDSSTNHCDGMTPSYCSPEQFQAFQIYRESRAKGSAVKDKIETMPMTKQSDIWSWAISILAMFHGRSPCKKGGQTASKVFDLFLQSPPSSTRPEIPAGMIDVLRWCFKENPADRPASMQFVADELIKIYEETTGEKYYRRQPQDAALTAESFSNRAISLLDLGKTSEALDLLRQANAVSPNQPQIKFNYTLALWRSGKLRDDQALKKINDLTQNNPTDPTACYVFGLTNLERGKLQASATAFHRALELDPYRKDIRRSLKDTQKLIPYDSLCIAQYVLDRKDEKQTPPLFVDESEEFMLIESVDKKFVLLKIQSGQKVSTFIRKKNKDVKDSEQSYLAVSEDYKWNLESTSPTEILVSSVASDKKSTPKVSYRFHAVDWGSLRPRSVATSSASKPKTLLLVPEENAINVTDEQSSQDLFSIPEDEQLLTAFAATPNGKWLATGGDESAVHVWNLSQERCMRTFHAAGGVVEALWFDPKGRVIVSLAKRNICQIWRVILICNHPRKLRAPHLLCLINSSEELQERQAQMEIIYREAKEAAQQNDNAKLVQSYQAARKIEGWKSERGKFEALLERRIPHSNLDDAVQGVQIQAHDRDVSTIALAWDSSFFVSAGKDRAIRLWTHSSSKNEKLTQNQQGSIQRPQNWKQALELDYHYDWVRSIALSPNNRFLVSGGWDHRVTLWDLATASRIRTLPESIKNLTKLSFAPDGRTIATGTATGAVTLWDLGTNQALIRLDVGSGYTRGLLFNRDGHFFVTATDDSCVRFWNGKSSLPSKEIKGFDANIQTLDLSYDNSKLVVGCDNGKIYIVDLHDPSFQTRPALSGHLGAINAVKLFPDGKWLASSGKDQTIRIWNLQKGEEIRKITSVDDEFCDLAVDFSALTLLAGSVNGSVRSWNLLWDYDFQAPSSYEELLSKVSPLCNYYAMNYKLSTSSASPRDYYRLNAEPFMKRCSDAGELTQDILQKICLEAKYRGLCDVPFEKIRKAVVDIWNKEQKTT